MTENYGGLDPTETSGASSRDSGTGDSTTQAAKDQAGEVKERAAQGGQQVAAVAKDEVGNVTAEAGQQAKDLWRQTRSELTGQAGQQQQRVAGGLRDLGDELGSMADRSEGSGLASDLAQQGSAKAHEVAQWLEGRDPGSLMEEVKGFARRKPGVFLAAAAGLGLVVARVGRGLAAEHQDQASPETMTSPAYTGGYPVGGDAFDVQNSGVDTTGGYASGGYASGVDTTVPAGTAGAAGTTGVSDPLGPVTGEYPGSGARGEQLP